MSELSSAIKQICEEKNLDYDMVISAIEMALAAAYRKDFGEKNQNIRVKFDPKTGKSEIFDVKTVVEDFSEEELQKMEELRERQQNGEKIEEENNDDEETGVELRKFNPRTDIQLSDALIIRADAKIDEEVVVELPAAESYGRMAAQTAKQVIIQKLREVEREMIYEDFKEKEHEVVSGIVQRKEARFVLVDLGKASGYLSIEEQIKGEKYNFGERIKVYIKEVRIGHKGAEIILSRRSEEILRKVFYLEIPEISNGLIEIKAIAREAGSRSKVAIYTEAENVDPVGSCVGQRGARIQTIISELGGEKVDIIEYDEDPSKFIVNALSPAQILEISLDEKEKKAVVKVASDKLSLAIGKSGQNVRLAARLTGWRIDIISDGVEHNEGEEQKENITETEELKKDDKKDEEEKIETPVEIKEETVKEDESKEEVVVEEENVEDKKEEKIKEKKTKEKKVKEKKEDKKEEDVEVEEKKEKKTKKVSK